MYAPYGCDWWEECSLTDRDQLGYVNRDRSFSSRICLKTASNTSAELGFSKMNVKDAAFFKKDASHGHDLWLYTEKCEEICRL